MHRLTFALAGLYRVTAEALKDNLNPIRGFVDGLLTTLEVAVYGGELRSVTIDNAIPQKSEL